MSNAQKELEKSLSQLNLSAQNFKPASSIKPKPKPPRVADSWEDDDSSSSGSETDRPLTAQESNDYPDAPPPTPISPTSSRSQDSAFSAYTPYGDFLPSTSSADRGSKSDKDRDIRPEKTDAVAKRLIAGALGVRAPKKTDEQRAYDRAVKEKEMRRRNAEKDAKLKEEEEAKRARESVWGD